MLESVIQTIQRAPGSYLLWLHLPETQDLSVGRLGSFSFPQGDYVYLGSASGPGGLQARLGRHLRGDGKSHWHIDYLRAVAQVGGFSCQMNAQPCERGTRLNHDECVWSQKLGDLPETDIPVPGFGSSDCSAGCSAHLVRFPGGVLKAKGRIARQVGLYLRIL